MTIEGSRYVKPIKRTSGPTRLVTAVPELVDTSDDPRRPVWDTTARAVHVTYSRRVGARWHMSASPTRLTVPDWWDWLDAMTPDGGRLYVISPIASDLLTVTRFWELVEFRRYHLREGNVVVKPRTKRRLLDHRPFIRQPILRGVPDIIACRGKHGSLLFCSVGNWVKSPLPELAQVHDIDPSLSRYVDPLTGEQSDPESRQAETIARHFRGLIGAWIAADNGPWRETVGQLAQSLWRRKFYTVKVCRHKDERAATLEDQSCHGARASVWYFGDVGDRGTLPEKAQPQPPVGRWQLDGTEAHRLDIRSMYPTLLRDKLFPVRLLSVRSDIDPVQLVGYAKHNGCIARVELDTMVPEYPLRGTDRTRFPLGRFWTTLAGPELRRALAEGAVRQVGDVARYELGRPLRDVASYLLDERYRAIDRKDKPGEVLAKALANALGGKFAQRTDRWVLDPKVPPEYWWGEWIVPARKKLPLRRYRSLCGVVVRHEKGFVGGKLLAAVYAYLTAYGRLWMRDLRGRIGADTILSQDTDGVWVTDAGLDVCDEKGLLGADEPGALLYKETAGFARWLDAKHYYHGGTWVLSGVRGGFTGGSKLIFRERMTTNPARGVPSEHPKSLRTFVRRIDLRGIDPDCPVDSKTGWSRPWHIGPDAPEPWAAHERRLDELDD